MSNTVGASDAISDAIPNVPGRPDSHVFDTDDEDGDTITSLSVGGPEPTGPPQYDAQAASTQEGTDNKIHSDAPSAGVTRTERNKDPFQSLKDEIEAKDIKIEKIRLKLHKAEKEHQMMLLRGPSEEAKSFSLRKIDRLQGEFDRLQKHLGVLIQQLEAAVNARIADPTRDILTGGEHSGEYSARFGPPWFWMGICFLVVVVVLVVVLTQILTDDKNTKDDPSLSPVISPPDIIPSPASFPNQLPTLAPSVAPSILMVPSGTPTVSIAPSTSAVPTSVAPPP